MARNITSNIIVPELLTEKNYEEWSSCMKNYLISQDLWECCTDMHVFPPAAGDDAVWRKKNATVLHVFQISCTSEMFGRIKGITSAKDAWCKLAETKDDIKFLGNCLSRVFSKSELIDSLRGIIPGESTFVERTQYQQFLGENRSATTIFMYLRDNPSSKRARFFSSGNTLLQFLIDVSAIPDRYIEEIISIMSEEELEIQDNKGDTALMYAVVKQRVNIVPTLIEKNKKLLNIPNNEGIVPIVMACSCSNKVITRLLYSEISVEILCEDNNGSLLLHYCILNKMLDIALDLLQKKPRLAVTNNHKGFSPIFTLSSQTSWFSNEIELPFWQRWIYNCIEVKDASLNKHGPNEQDNISRRELPQSYGLVSSLQNFIGIKDIYEHKFIHTCAREILKCMNTELSTLNANEVVESGVIPALFQATHRSLFKFVEVITMYNYDLIDGQSYIALIFCAIEYRQDRCIKRLTTVANFKSFSIAFSDEDNNSILHLVAKLAHESSLARVSGAALQMQREIQWFKAIESIAPDLKAVVNKEGETPQQVFSREHTELKRKGEEWMRQTSQSYSVVSAFIITIMFAAAFTLPGGNNQNSGFPMFQHKKAFMVFMLSDAISLFSASTSVMMFLGILTSRFAEEDFLRSLPTKLLIGLISLFVSIATMMVAFSTAVAIMLHGQWWIVMLLVVFASIPVIVFLWLQSEQMIGIFNSTYRWRLFKKEKSSKKEKCSSSLREKIVAFKTSIQRFCHYLCGESD